MTEVFDYIDDICLERVEDIKKETVDVLPDKIYKNFIDAYSEDFAHAVIRLFGCFPMIEWEIVTDSIFRDSSRYVFDEKNVITIKFDYSSKMTFPMLKRLYQTIFLLKKNIAEKEKNLIKKAVRINRRYNISDDSSDYLAFDDLSYEQIEFYKKKFSSPVITALRDVIDEREFRYCEPRFVEQCVAKILDELNNRKYSSFNVFKIERELEEFRGFLNGLKFDYSNLTEYLYHTTSVHFKFWNAPLDALRNGTCVSAKYFSSNLLCSKIKGTRVYRSDQTKDLYILVQLDSLTKNSLTWISIKVNYHKKRYNFYMFKKILFGLFDVDSQPVKELYNRLEKRYG